MKKTLLVIFFLSFALNSKAAVPALPTFDFTNFTNGVESMLKAVEYYNTSVNNAKIYINQLKTMGRSLSKLDFENILNMTMEATEMVLDLVDEIQAMELSAKEKRRLAEVKSRAASLKILKLAVNPSLSNLKDYVDSKNLSSQDMRTQMKTIAEDAKKSIEYLLEDYNEETKEALDSINLSMNDITKSVNKWKTSVESITGKNLDSSTSLQAISSLKDNITELLSKQEKLKKDAEDASYVVEMTREELQTELGNWQSIIQILDSDINLSNKLLNSIANY